VAAGPSRGGKAFKDQGQVHYWLTYGKEKCGGGVSRKGRHRKKDRHKRVSHTSKIREGNRGKKKKGGKRSTNRSGPDRGEGGGGKGEEMSALQVIQ